MSKVVGRRDDMLVLSGVNVYPSEVERVLLAEAALAPDYLLVVDARQVPARLIACCEYRTAAAGQPPAAERAAGLIEDRLRDQLGVRVRLHIVPAGTVPRTEVGKAVRVVTWDKGQPPVPGLA
jgi:phenylacetate-CoA ligase